MAKIRFYYIIYNANNKQIYEPQPWSINYERIVKRQPIGRLCMMGPTKNGAAARSVVIGGFIVSVGGKYFANYNVCRVIYY